MSKKEMCVKKNETKKLNQFNKEVVVEIWNTMAVCVIRLVGSNTLKKSVDNCLYKLQCQETLRSHFLLNRPHFVFFLDIQKSRNVSSTPIILVGEKCWQFVGWKTNLKSIKAKRDEREKKRERSWLCTSLYSGQVVHFIPPPQESILPNYFSS